VEIWKNFCDNYSISNYGRIKNNKTNRILKLQVNHKGYYKVNISINNKIKTVFPHRLVAQYFLQNPNNYNVVNHKDCNKLNNLYSNLEWCTLQYNSQHASDNGLLNIVNKKGCIQKDFSGNVINKFNSLQDAAKFLNKLGGDSHIGDCCRGLRKSAYGYLWEYK
jgi:hypothetical protein